MLRGSIKEQLHRLVDELPEEEAERLLSDLDLSGTADTQLSQEDLAAIRRGLEDVRAGRITPREEIRRK